MPQLHIRFPEITNERLWIMFMMIQKVPDPVDQTKFEIELMNLLDENNISWTTHKSGGMFKEENISIMAKDIYEAGFLIRRGEFQRKLSSIIKDYMTISCVIYYNSDHTTCEFFDLYAISPRLEASPSWVAITGDDVESDINFLPLTKGTFLDLSYIYYSGLLDDSIKKKKLVINKLKKFDPDEFRGYAFKFLY